VGHTVIVDGIVVAGWAEVGRSGALAASVEEVEGEGELDVDVDEGGVEVDVGVGVGVEEVVDVEEGVCVVGTGVLVLDGIDAVTVA
jgi:hypothetical protein